MIYICFLVLAMLAASPQRGKAADSPDAVPGRHTYVVRVDPRSGRLVRRELAPKIPPKQITDLVEKTARAQGVDPLLVHSMIQVESNYDARAVSPKGAQGLMQLMPSTARMLGVNDSFDPGENIEAGVKYLKYLESVYKDDRLALAAYNAGPGAVEKYRQIPPYKETRKYVERVGRNYQEALKAQKAADLSPNDGYASAPAATPVTEETHPRLEQFIDQNGRLHLRTAEN